MTNANVIFFNPRDCRDCLQGYTTWNHVITEAVRDGHNVISCLNFEAEIGPLAQKLSLHKPTLLLYFNHGAANAAAGNTVPESGPYEPVIWSSGYVWPYGAHASPMSGLPAYSSGQAWAGNTQILKNMIVYIDACNTAMILGPDIIRKGARAYIGNTGLWWWIQTGGHPGTYQDGYDDPLAYYFWWSSQNVARALLKQKTVAEAFDIGTASYNACIDLWVNHPPLPEWAADEIGYLVIDRDEAVKLGDTSAKILVCEDVTIQAECIDCGGVWINNQCKPMLPASTTKPLAVTIFNAGFATIVGHTAPTSINPNTAFEITYTVKNTGGNDQIYGEAYENDQLLPSTQWEEVVAQNGTVTKTISYPDGTPYPINIRIEAGHIQTTNKIRDDTEIFNVMVTGSFFGTMVAYNSYFMRFMMKMVGNAHIPDSSGLAQEIVAYLKTDSSAHKARAALYTLSGTSGVLSLYAMTEEISVASATPKRYTFSFTTPPVITQGVKYVLMLFSASQVFVGSASSISPAPEYYQTDTTTGYPNFPTTATFAKTTLYDISIYCRYL
jgi:hypothetical protein